jgi:hypothetical protein
MLVACGDSKPRVALDAGVDAPQATDATPRYPACRELDSALGTPMPAHVTGTVSGADLASPASCTTVDAPYGIESAGPDSVVKLDGLVAGRAYIVHVTSASDLAFYVVTDCTTPTGPAASDCLLFEDAAGPGDEVGRFIATGSTAYVIVDYYASHPPPDASFTLDAYQEACTTNLECGGGTPVCDQGRCVECATSFDCTDAAKPSCETTTHACAAGIDACLSDDPGEPANDGPAGATPLVLDGAGNGAISGQICSSPATEADYISFDVTTLGEVWDFSLQWTGASDIDLELFDARGEPLGLSYWEHPEHARLTYLAVGTYYLRVSEFSGTTDPSPVSYSVSAHRATGTGCTTTADCAGEYRNQIYRGSCTAGACVPITGGGAVPEAGVCDSTSDCAPGLSCPSFYFVGNADTRDVCAPGCTGDSACGVLGTGYVCTTYLASNFCVQKCTADAQCPAAISSQPVSGPWARLTCDLPTGRCLP